MSSGILSPGGGYKRLKSYRKSLIVFDGTACFVRRFLKPGDRTVDQMVQAARSGKQNIVVGSMAASVSMAYSKNESYETYRPYLENRSAGTCANIMICLISQCTCLPRRQQEKLAEEFPKTDGIRERMAKSRMEHRNKKQSDPQDR